MILLLPLRGPQLVTEQRGAAVRFHFVQFGSDVHSPNGYGAVRGARCYHQPLTTTTTAAATTATAVGLHVGGG